LIKRYSSTEIHQVAAPHLLFCCSTVIYYLLLFIIPLHCKSYFYAVSIFEDI